MSICIYLFVKFGNSIKSKENMNKNYNILFVKNSKKIPSISNTIQHTPMTWCTYLQSFEKLQQCVFEFNTARKLNVMEGRTDRQGAFQYLPSRAFGAAGDKALEVFQFTYYYKLSPRKKSH